MTFPSYDRLVDFPNQAVAPTKLNDELLATELAGYKGLQVVGDTITTVFDPEPDAAGKAVVDAVIAAHDGIRYPAVTFLASSKLIEVSRGVSSSDWTLLGGVVTNPGFFDSDLAHLFGRVVGEYEADGEVELRLVERKAGDDVVLSSPVWILPETSGAIPFQSNTTVPPRSGENSFRLEARLTTATSATFYFTSLTLLKVI